MIIEYESKYDEDIKDLLVELQEHIVSIDKEKFNILTDEYREKYFLDTMNEVKEKNGKIFIYIEEDRAIGLVIGFINNEEESSYDFKCPKRGRISELIVSKNVRSKGIGKLLLNKMEDYLNNLGCKNILIEVFAYNSKALDFYEREGYHLRMTEVIK